MGVMFHTGPEKEMRFDPDIERIIIRLHYGFLENDSQAGLIANWAGSTDFSGIMDGNAWKFLKSLPTRTATLTPEMPLAKAFNLLMGRSCHLGETVRYCRSICAAATFYNQFWLSWYQIFSTHGCYEMKAITVDKSWIQEVGHKNERAFEQLFTLCKDNVYTIALAYMEDTVDAEAVVLEVFLRVWKAGEKLLDVADFNAWLFTITKNCALTALKKEALRRKRELEFIDTNTGGMHYTPEDSMASDLQAVLHAAMNKLTPQQRKIFELSRLHGYDRAAIAKNLGIAPATVSAHLTIALNTVRSFLEKNAKNISSVGPLLIPLLKIFYNN